HDQVKGFYRDVAAAFGLDTPARVIRLRKIYGDFGDFVRKVYGGKDPFPELSNASSVEAHLRKFVVYHNLAEPVRRHNRKKHSQRLAEITGAQDLPNYDFHQIITSLHNFPSLLRSVGLVIDLAVDATGLAVDDPDTSARAMHIGNAAGNHESIVVISGHCVHL